MKEKQNRFRSFSDGYIPFSSEDSYQLMELFRWKSTNSFALQTRQGNDFRNTHELDCCNIMDGLSKDTHTLNRVSLNDDHHTAVFKHLNEVKYTDMLKSDGNAEDILSTPELECLMIMNDYVNYDKDEPTDSVPSVVTSSDMFQEDRNIYTVEDVLDYEPELIVCYKETNYNIVKDICVDEGMPLEDKGSINLHFDDYSGPGANEYASDEEPGDLDSELLIHITKKCLAKEDGNIVSSFARESKCLADLMNLDDQNPDVVFQASEKDASKKVENDVMDVETVVTKLVPTEKLGTRGFLRFFSKSLKNQEHEARQPKKVIEHPDINKRHQESVVDNEYGNYSNNPSMDSVVISSSLNRSSMNIHRDTECNYEEDRSTNNFKDQRAGMDGNIVSEVQNADIESFVSIHQQLIATNSILDAENHFPLNEGKNLSEPRSFRKSPQQLQMESCSSNSPANTEVPSAGPNEIGRNGSSTTPGEACDGELILCNVSGHISYSGPVTISGSTSMRSESSTTSARSFAFPQLQAEWNFSPVKMGNANRRRLRKKRGSWKRGILCCRF